jgi:AAA domain
MNLLKIPDELKVHDHWVVWKYETRGGKATKPLYDVQTGEYAKSNDPSTWTSFERAVAAADVLSGNDFEGVGFVPRGTDIVGLDFDGVVCEGVVESYVLEILRLCGNPYAEISPSGNGLRAFIRCSSPPKKCKFEGDPRVKAQRPNKKYGAEIYHGGAGAHYLTVTGNRFGDGNGIPKLDNPELVYFLLEQFGNEKFKSLWIGDLSAYGNDHSKADFALCCELAQAFNLDEATIATAFLASPLGQRAKSTDREDYVPRTIKAAVEKVRAGKTVGHELEFHLPAVALRSHRDYVIAPAFGQKDGWFPLGDPSLIGGASGANKTTLMLDLLRAQAIKMPFLGHETCGRPYLVLMFDRGENANKRTLERMGLMLDKIPIEYLSLVTGTAAAQAIVDKIEAADPLPQIVFIEGWDMLVKDANKMDVVAPFMREMQKIASHFHLALIGSVGAPKSKPGDGYISKRDSIFGSVAWSRMSETVMALQYPAGEDTSLQRELTVMLRNAPSESFSLIMKEGRLEIQTEADKAQVQTKETAHEIEWFKHQARLGKADPSKKWWTVLDLERSLGVSDATAWRWTKNAHAKGYIVKKTGRRIGTKAAQFCWNESASNPLWIEQTEQDEVEAHAIF